MDILLLASSAGFGAFLSVCIEVLKIAPKEWIDRVLTTDPESRKTRLQTLLFALCGAFALIMGIVSGQVSFASLDAFLASLGVAYSATQLMYYVAIKKLSPVVQQ